MPIYESKLVNNYWSYKMERIVFWNINSKFYRDSSNWKLLLISAVMVMFSACSAGPMGVLPPLVKDKLGTSTITLIRSSSFHTYYKNRKSI